MVNLKRGWTQWQVAGCCSDSDYVTGKKKKGGWGGVGTNLQMPQSSQWNCSLSTYTHRHRQSFTSRVVSRSSKTIYIYCTVVAEAAVCISRHRPRSCRFCRSTPPCRHRSCSTPVRSVIATGWDVIKTHKVNAGPPVPRVIETWSDVIQELR